MSRLIETQWETYQRMDTAGEPAAELKKIRRAFYAGAQAGFSVLVSRLDPDAEHSIADHELVDAMLAEFRAFAISEARKP